MVSGKIAGWTAQIQSAELTNVGYSMKKVTLFLKFYYGQDCGNGFRSSIVNSNVEIYKKNYISLIKFSQLAAHVFVLEVFHQIVI